MKFTMYDKTVNNEKYRDNPYRTVNFKRNKDGNPVCPDGKKSVKLRDLYIKDNQYGRTEELYQCEDSKAVLTDSDATRAKRATGLSV